MILHNWEATCRLRNQIIRVCTGWISESVCVPVVAISSLIVLYLELEIDNHCSTDVIGHPVGEIAYFIDSNCVAVHVSAGETIGVGFCFRRVASHGSVAVVGIQYDLSRGSQVDLLDVGVLQHVGDVYFSDVVESVLQEVVVGGQGRSK